MGELALLESIGIMIVAAAAMVLVGRRLYVPNIVLYILTGLLLGPVLGLVDVAGAEHGDSAAYEGAADVIAHVGIALLLFLVGLELSLDKIRDVGKVAVVAGLGQIVFTAVIGFAISMAIQFSAMESLFIATALTFSSTVVVVKLLDQKKDLHVLYGRIAVGIFLVQDLVVIIVLTFLAGLGGTAGEGAEAAETMRNWLAVALNLTWAFVGMGLLLGVALLASRYLLARPFAWMAASSEGLLIWSLFWCFGFVVAAEAMNLSPEIGAFLAGMSLAQLDGAHDLRRRVHPLMNFFIAIFFVSLGAQMQPTDAVDLWRSGLVLSLFVLLGNPFIFMWIIAKAGYTERTSFLTSVTVAQISEFSFIFAAVGMSAGLIDATILAVITMVGLVTIAVSSYMILYNHELYAMSRRWGLLRMFGAKQGEEEKPPQVLKDHVVIVGMNAMGRQMVHELAERGETVLAIDTDARKLRDLRAHTMIGSVDHMAVVEEAHLADAKLVVSTLHIEDTNNLLAYRCKQMGVPVAIHAFDRSVVGDLRQLQVDYLIDPKSRWISDVTVALEHAGFAAGPAEDEPEAVDEIDRDTDDERADKPGGRG